MTTRNFLAPRSNWGQFNATPYIPPPLSNQDMQIMRQEARARNYRAPVQSRIDTMMGAGNVHTGGAPWESHGVGGFGGGGGGDANLLQSGAAFPLTPMGRTKVWGPELNRARQKLALDEPIPSQEGRIAARPSPGDMEYRDPSYRMPLESLSPSLQRSLTSEPRITSATYGGPLMIQGKEVWGRGDVIDPIVRQPLGPDPFEMRFPQGDIARDWSDYGLGPEKLEKDRQYWARRNMIRPGRPRSPVIPNRLPFSDPHEQWGGRQHGFDIPPSRHRGFQFFFRNPDPPRNYDVTRYMGRT